MPKKVDPGMSVKLPVKTLKEMLKEATPFAAVKSTLPVLVNVRLAAMGDKLTIQATNLECGISISKTATVSFEGTITIPAQSFREMVGSLNEKDEIALEVNPKTMAMQIVSASFKSVLKGIDAQEFPPMPTIVKTLAENVPAEALVASMMAVEYAASHENARENLKSVFFDLGTQFINFISTDSFRFGVHMMQFSPKEAGQFIIPVRSVANIARVLTGNIKIGTSANDSALVFEGDGYMVCASKINDNYPDWRALIKTWGEPTMTLKVTKKDVMQAIAFCDVIAQGYNHLISLESGDGKLNLSATANELGSANHQIDCSGNLPGKMNFNARFLLDAINHIPDEEITIAVCNNTVLRIKGNASKYTMHSVMAMNDGREAEEQEKAAQAAADYKAEANGASAG